MATAAITHGARLRLPPTTTGSIAVGAFASAIRASPIACSLCVASRSRHRRSNCRTNGGTFSGKRGAFMITAARISTTVSPVYSARPVSISDSTTPNAQMSARRSTGLPLACSGLM